MQTRVMVAAVAVVVVGAGAWLLYSNSNRSADNAALQEQFEWSFIDRGVDAELSAPQTAVNLRIAGVDVPLGTYTGSCFKIVGSSWELLQNELSGAICWWAGGGVELGVFDERGELVLKQGEIEEGAAEGGGFRGNFKPLVRTQ